MALVALMVPALVAGPNPTTYQIPLVTEKAADFDAKASAANTALTEAELATQNRIDAANAEVAAWTAYAVAKQAAQTSLLELSSIASGMYDTHAAETIPGEATEPDPEPTPAPPEEEPLLLRPSRR